jgi:hypothetical protein
MNTTAYKITLKSKLYTFWSDSLMSVGFFGHIVNIHDGVNESAISFHLGKIRCEALRYFPEVIDYIDHLPYIKPEEEYKRLVLEKAGKMSPFYRQIFLKAAPVFYGMVYNLPGVRHPDEPVKPKEGRDGKSCPGH